MATEDSVFVTDAGARISVRMLPATSPATALLEPLYASDLELLDGATGELQTTGSATLRGTLRREGRAFALYSEPPARETPQRRTRPRPSETFTEPLRDEFEEPARVSGPSSAEAIEAAETLSGFVRDDPDIALADAKRAHSLISRFIAQREGKPPK